MKCKMPIKLSDYIPARNNQEKLLNSLKQLKECNSRENALRFMWAGRQALTAGISLSHEQIKEIFDEVYGDQERQEQNIVIVGDET